MNDFKKIEEQAEEQYQMQLKLIEVAKKMDVKFPISFSYGSIHATLTWDEILAFLRGKKYKLKDYFILHGVLIISYIINGTSFLISTDKSNLSKIAPNCKIVSNNVVDEQIVCDID